jgi:hypothetical protein
MCESGLGVQIRHKVISLPLSLLYASRTKIDISGKGLKEGYFELVRNFIEQPTKQQAI